MTLKKTQQILVRYVRTSSDASQERLLALGDAIRLVQEGKLVELTGVCKQYRTFTAPRLGAYPSLEIQGLFVHGPDRHG